MSKIATVRVFSCFNLLLLAGLAFGVFPIMSGAVDVEQPFNMTRGVTEISNDVFELHMLIFWVCVSIGVIVFAVMFYSILVHRKSRGHKAANFHDNAVVEILWTAVPTLILVLMAVPAAQTLINMEKLREADHTIKVTGYQWLWEYEYLGEDLKFYSKLSTPFEQISQDGVEKGPNYLLEVDRKLVLPVGKNVRFLITSGDVLHAWWVPALALKKDAVPGFINEVWTNISKQGTYRGQCAELCGRYHGFMPIVVEAVSEPEFQAWLAAASKDGENVPHLVAQGAD